MKLKKLFLIIGIIFALSIACGISASAAEVLVSGTCGQTNNLTWTLDDEGVLTISGEGNMKMDDYVHSYTPQWYSYRSLITSAVIEDGVTSVGLGAFRDCSSLTDVTIPKSVTGIGDCAFSGCSDLESIIIPDSVTWVGTYAFENCIRLKYITIPDSVTFIGNNAFKYTGYYFDDANWTDNVLYIGNKLIVVDSSISGNYAIKEGTKVISSYAFANSQNLTGITIPDSVTDICRYAFNSCWYIENVTIGNSVTSIGDCAFAGCSSLTSITIPDSVTSIGRSAFFRCSSLTSITIPDSVTSIGYDAFGDCTGLEHVTIPGNIGYIPTYCFTNCTNLQSVTIKDGVQEIDGSAFNGCNKLKYITIHGTLDYVESSALSVTPEHIYFGGSEEDWNAMTINDSYFANAPRTYNITPADGISMTESSVEVNKNSTKALSAEVTPAEVSNRHIFWKSSDTSVATVDENGVVKGVAMGEAVITARSADGGYLAECKVTVTGVSGDMDGDGEVKIKDVVQMFKHLMDPEEYPYEGSCDVNSDGKENMQDAVYLFKHMMDPVTYPIG